MSPHSIKYLTRDRFREVDISEDPNLHTAEIVEGNRRATGQVRYRSVEKKEKQSVRDIVDCMLGEDDRRIS